LIHLDTGFLILALQPGSEQDDRLRKWIESGELLGISAAAWAEFLCGPLASQDAMIAAAITGEAIPLTASAAVLAADSLNTAKNP